MYTNKNKRTNVETKYLTLSIRNKEHDICTHEKKAGRKNLLTNNGNKCILTT